MNRTMAFGRDSLLKMSSKLFLPFIFIFEKVIKENVFKCIFILVDKGIYSNYKISYINYTYTY